MYDITHRIVGANAEIEQKQRFSLPMFLANSEQIHEKVPPSLAVTLQRAVSLLMWQVHQCQSLTLFSTRNSHSYIKIYLEFDKIEPKHVNQEPQVLGRYLKFKCDTCMEFFRQCLKVKPKS